MTPTSLVAAVAPRTERIHEKTASMFLQEEKILLQNGTLHFVFRIFTQTKRAWYLKGKNKKRMIIVTFVLVQ